MFLLAKKGNAYYPLYDSDYKESQKDKQGDVREVKEAKPRNYKYHKKFFALLKLGFENQDEILTFDHYRAVTIMRAGYFHEIKTKKGLVFIPESIKFENMKAERFEKLYKDVLTVISITADDVENEIINYL